MVVTISPEAPQTKESIWTCQFAQRVATLVKVSTLVYWIDQCGSFFVFIYVKIILFGDSSSTDAYDYILISSLFSSSLPS